MSYLLGEAYQELTDVRNTLKVNTEELRASGKKTQAKVQEVSNKVLNGVPTFSNLFIGKFSASSEFERMDRFHGTVTPGILMTIQSRPWFTDEVTFSDVLKLNEYSDVRMYDRFGGFISLRTFVVDVDNLDTQVTALDTQVTALDTQVTALDTQVTALDTQVTALDNQVTALDTQVTTLDTQVSSLLSVNRVYEDVAVTTHTFATDLNQTVTSFGSERTVTLPLGYYWVVAVLVKSSANISASSVRIDVDYNGGTIYVQPFTAVAWSTTLAFPPVLYQQTLTNEYMYANLFLGDFNTVGIPSPALTVKLSFIRIE